MTPLVPYFQGMFANEPDRSGLASYLHAVEATCHHEAAHAVAAYVFGHPIYSIGVCAEYDDTLESVAFGGEVVDAKRPVRVDRSYCSRYFQLGTIFAAGAAGERRYRYDTGAPMRMLGGTECDHRNIDTIGKMLEWKHGRSRFAYQRLVWFAAQRMMQQQDVWAAVSELAEWLYFAVCDEIPEEPGVHWAFVSPRDAHSIFRQAGLQRGMFRSSSSELQAA